jgi:hypothetical protein
MSNRSMASMGDNSHVGVSDLFSDHTLAKRLERTEAYGGAGFVETRARLDPSCGAERYTTPEYKTRVVDPPAALLLHSTEPSIRRAIALFVVLSPRVSDLEEPYRRQE